MARLTNLNYNSLLVSLDFTNKQHTISFFLTPEPCQPAVNVQTLASVFLVTQCCAIFSLIVFFSCDCTSKDFHWREKQALSAECLFSKLISQVASRNFKTPTCFPVTLCWASSSSNICLESYSAKSLAKQCVIFFLPLLWDWTFCQGSLKCHFLSFFISVPTSVIYKWI